MCLDSIAGIDSSPLKLRELPTPEPGPRQIRVRIRCCAICRTDLHVIEGDLPQSTMPIVPGHQAVGVIDALGDGCRTLRVGERVGIAWLRHTCGSCIYCAAERENLCPDQRFTGYHADGGYAEYAVVDEDFAYRIPDVFDDVQAAPLLCAGIIGYRALLRSDLPAGGKLAIFGFGSSAHVVIQIATYRRCEVYVVTRGASHRELARKLGAAWVGDLAADVPAKVDSAIIFAPAGELVPPALAALRPSGTLTLAGIHMSDVPALNYERHLFYEKNIRSVTANTRADGRSLFAEAAKIPIRPQVTTYALAESNRALQDLKADRINGAGVLVIGGR